MFDLPTSAIVLCVLCVALALFGWELVTRITKGKSHAEDRKEEGMSLERTVQEILDQINATHGRVEIHARVSTKDLLPSNILKFKMCMNGKGLQCQVVSGQEELKFWKLVIFKKTPHQISISGWVLPSGEYKNK